MSIREKVIICSILTSNKAPMSMVKCSSGKPQNTVSGRESKTKSLEKEWTMNTRNNIYKKVEETNEPEDKVKVIKPCHSQDKVK